MKFYLWRRLPSIFSTSITPKVNSPPRLFSSSPSLSLTYLQSVCNQIKLLVRNPQSYSSLTALDSLLAKTQFLDSATCLVLIDRLSQLNKLGRTKTLILHLKSRGRVSDTFLYSLVFNFLAKDGSVNDVENVWEEINGSVKTPNFSNYVSLVCKFGDIDEIKDVYERILMGPPKTLERQTYVALSAALCNVNEGFLAKNLVNEMYDKGMEVDNWTYFLLFQCYCRNGDFDEADVALRKLVKNGFTIDISIYGSFLHGLCKWGKLREANKLFRKLIKRAPVPSNGSRELKEGRRAIFQLKSEGIVPKMMAYETYFRALCNTGKLIEAEVLLKKMMSGIRVPEICVYGSFIKALFRADRDEDAMKFFKNEKKKGFVCVDEICRYVIMGLCEKGKADDAFRVFHETYSVRCKSGICNDLVGVCNCILDCYWKESRVADAEVFFERFGEVNEETYRIMIRGYCLHDNDVSKAVVVFEEMLKRKMVVDGDGELVIRRLCDDGRLNEAFILLNKMIEDGHLLFCKRWTSLFHSILEMVEGKRELP